jgi:hypothetical protein
MISEIALRVIETISCLVSPMIGPNGRDVLLETENQSFALLTSSGHVLLTHALKVNSTENKENAIAQFLLNHLNNHNKQYGDGCTTVVLMVAAGLREAIIRSKNTNTTTVQVHRSMVRLSYSLRCLRQAWIAADYYHVMTSIWATNLMHDDIVKTLRTLIITNLAGKFDSGVVHVLSEVLREWVLGQNVKKSQCQRLDVAALQNRVNYIAREWPVLKAPDEPLSRSQILDDEVLVTRPFFQEQSWAKHNYQTSKGGAIRFAVVTASFASDASSQLMSSHTKVKTFLNDARAEDVILSESNWSKRCIDAIGKLGIHMLLCTEALPEEFAGHLRNRHILAIDHVDEDQARFLCERVGIVPITSGTPKAFENVHDSGDHGNAIGIATSVGRVTLGGTNCVYIRGLYLPKKKALSGQLLLRAKSDGLLRQYEREVKRCIVVIQRWLEESFNDCKGLVDNNTEDTLRVVRGGGSTEAAGHAWCLHLADQLFMDDISPECVKEYTHILERGELSLGFTVLAAMFGSVPLALAKRQKRGGIWMQQKKHLNKVLKNREHLNNKNIQLLSLKPTRIELVDLDSKIPIETVSSRMANILKAVDILSSILRIDDVMKVSTRLKPHPNRLVQRRGTRQSVGKEKPDDLDDY